MLHTSCWFLCCIGSHLFAANVPITIYNNNCLSFNRLSIPNMEDLKRRILQIVSNCNKPKVKQIKKQMSETIKRMTFSDAHIKAPAITNFCVWCRSTASSCRDFGMNCLEETRMTSPQRWNTEGRRRSASHCWGRSHSSFATHPPIKVSAQTTHLCTAPQTFLSSFPDASCISLRMDRHAGLQQNSLLNFFFMLECAAPIRS